MPEMKDSGIEWIGEIPKDWKIIPVKFFFRIDRGRVISVLDLDENGKYPVYSSQTENDGCFGYLNTYDYSGPAITWTTDGAKAGTVFFRDGKYNCTNVCGILSFKKGNAEKSNIRFMTYAISIAAEQNKRKDINGFKIMSNEMAKIRFAVPLSVDEQKIIANFLDSKCAEIDALTADIEKQIEVLEEYKKSVITEAVTKGLDPNVEMKDSGIEWVGMIPKDWKVYRIADIYEDRNERGNEELPLLSVSINTGVSDKELTDEEQERVFLRSEDKSKYKRVYPGDITYNMMRAWQGALGAVRVEGMVSPAYVVAKPNGRVDVDSRFIEMLLRSVAGIEEINRYSYGIMDFRKRLYWPQFRIIKVALPNVFEQKRIADYLDKKSSEIDGIISKQKETISTLMDYKKSLIYEYVTGKKEVSAG